MMEQVISIVSFILIGVGVSSPTLDYTIFRGRRLVSPSLSLAALAVCAIILAFASALAIGEPKETVFDGIMEVGFFELFLWLVATVGGLLVTISSMKEVKKWSTSPSFYSLLILAVLGTYYLAAVQDFVLFVGAWALVSVISYVLVGIRKDERSVEGAVKYSLMGILASVLILYAIGIVYGLTGSTSIASISAINDSQRPLALVASILFISAFGFKLGIVPFHGWLPDVYGKVNPMLIAFITGVVAVATGAILIRVIFPLAPIVGDQWPVVIGLLSIFTMSFGNIVALLQKDLQRMMAYSSIAQMGYLLVGVAAAQSTGADLAIQGIGLHLSSYMMAKVGIFISLSYLMRKGWGLGLDDLRGLGSRSPLAAGAMLILLLNLLGIPPLIGFWSKFLLFTSIIEVAPWLALGAIINSGISVGYYIQPIRYMFFAEGSQEREENPREADVAMVLVAAVMTIGAGIILPSVAVYFAN